MSSRDPRPPDALAVSPRHWPVPRWRQVLDRAQSFWRTPFVDPAEWRRIRVMMGDLTDRRKVAAAAVSARALFRYFYGHMETIKGATA